MKRLHPSSNVQLFCGKRDVNHSWMIVMGVCLQSTVDLQAIDIAKTKTSTAAEIDIEAS